MRATIKRYLGILLVAWGAGALLANAARFSHPAPAGGTAEAWGGLFGLLLLLAMIALGVRLIRGSKTPDDRKSGAKPT
jgi:hypothetical protein